jgi:dTDP-4-amino-4,6-dideoxy-D-galactose acyltransferase
MIKELAWDTNLFQRRIGELIPVAQGSSYIKDVLKKAKKDGFQYLICKVKSQDTSFINLLESSGFYLTDIGVILAIKTDAFFQETERRDLKMKESIRIATHQDMPELKKMIKSLFLESRFYNDPFFTRDEADRLFEAWIENSVKGEAADIVFFIPRIGLITCRTKGKNSGEILLVGVRKNHRGKGFGTLLVSAAMQWFEAQNSKLVAVRTQLKNIGAINFYLALGFFPKSHDIVLGKIL